MKTGKSLEKTSEKKLRYDDAMIYINVIPYLQNENCSVTHSPSLDNNFNVSSQLTFTCSKSTIETLEKGVKFVEI